jgi:hypothetical protein
MSNEQKLTKLMSKCHSYEVLSALKKEIERRAKEEWNCRYVNIHLDIRQADDAEVYACLYRIIGEVY